jgi:SH3-like domain-containing protein
MQVSVARTAAMAMGLVALLAGAAAAQDKPADDTDDLSRGAVTNLPLPRYVSLKTNEGNARRGPGLTHRIDWVFSRAGMPLRVTAEYENWRRIEDAEGVGGWVHYSLLSGTRSILVTAAMLDLHSVPLPDAPVVLRAEAGVIGRVLECKPDWCRLNINGEKGWAAKTDFWGVDPEESFE